MAIVMIIAIALLCLLAEMAIAGNGINPEGFKSLPGAAWLRAGLTVVVAAVAETLVSAATPVWGLAGSIVIMAVMAGAYLLKTAGNGNVLGTALAVVLTAFLYGVALRPLALANWTETAILVRVAAIIATVSAAFVAAWKSIKEKGKTIPEAVVPLAVAAMVALATMSFMDSTVGAPATTAAPAGETVNVNAGNLHWYNFDMLATEEPFNFGPSPIADGLTAEDYREDLRERTVHDPALLAAIAAYTDSIVNTRYMGVFYDSVAGHWAEAINLAKDQWTEDSGSFQKAHTALWNFLGKTEVTLVNERSATDLMYMNPFTGTDRPDIIVLRTDQVTGPWLIFTVDIKGNEFEIPLRIVCGYQPSDCERLMGITPSETPQKPAGGSPSEPSGVGGTPNTPDNPTPPPVGGPADVEPKKDPSLSSNTGKNDDPGPGPDTNNGEGAQESAAEKPGNSGGMDSYDEYKDEVDRLGDANNKAEEQEQNGGAPSYTPPTDNAPGGLDDNSQNGNSYSPGSTGVDTPSTDSDDVGAVEGDPPAAPWGGPGSMNSTSSQPAAQQSGSSSSANAGSSSSTTGTGSQATGSSSPANTGSSSSAAGSSSYNAPSESSHSGVNIDDNSTSGNPDSQGVNVPTGVDSQQSELQGEAAQPWSGPSD